MKRVTGGVSASGLRPRKRTVSMTHLSDAELTVRFQGGDASAFDLLCERYERKLIGIAGTFTIPGMDLEDKVAESRFAFTKAVQSWQPDGGTLVKTYVRNIVERRLIEMQRRANTKRQVPAYDQLRLDMAVWDAEDVCLVDTLSAESDVYGDVALSLAAQEAVQAVAEKLRAALMDATPLGMRVRTAVVGVWGETHKGDLSVGFLKSALDLFQPTLDLFGQLPPAVEEKLKDDAFDLFLRRAIGALVAIAEGAEVAEYAKAHGLSTVTVKAAIGVCGLEEAS
jgi:DNA-directed RNA polymerase specialized sigma24 family protein